MKIVRIISVAILSTVACQLANAQSSVTLYGILDESIQYVDNTGAGGQKNQIGMQTGNWYGSRWGMKGKEDIGNQTNVIFRLESGFNINTGSASGTNQQFSRAAYVGIANNQYGEFRVGRQQLIMSDIVLPVQANNYFEYVTAPGDVDLADGELVLNNAVSWLSPNWSGLRLGAQYAFGNVAGNTGSDQAYNLAANYTTGPWKVAAGYIHVDNGTSRGGGNEAGVFFSTVNSAYTTASAYNIVRAGTSYAIGSVILGGYYSFSEYLSDASSTFRTPEIYNNASVYAYWKITPAWSSMIGADYMRTHGDSSAIYRTVAAAVDYNLSKRTTIYAFLDYGRAFGTNGLGEAQTVIGDEWPTAGAASQGLAIVGIDHRF